MGHKLLLSVIGLCLLSYAVVDACNANGECTYRGALGSTCLRSCECNVTGALSCIENTCRCGLNAIGDYYSNCSANCPCKASLGLVCVNGACVCNATGFIWDNDRCEQLATTPTSCDALLYFPPTAGTIVTLPTSTMWGSALGSWRCNPTTKTIYSPSYNATSGKGKYIVLDSMKASEVFATCKAQKASRLTLNDDDEFLKLLTSFLTVGTIPNPFWMGASKDPKVDDWAWDNGFLVDKLKLGGTTQQPTPAGNCLVLKLSTANPPQALYHDNLCMLAQGTQALKAICEF